MVPVAGVVPPSFRIRPGESRLSRRTTLRTSAPRRPPSQGLRGQGVLRVLRECPAAQRGWQAVKRLGWGSDQEGLLWGRADRKGKGGSEPGAWAARVTQQPRLSPALGAGWRWAGHPAVGVASADRSPPRVPTPRSPELARPPGCQPPRRARRARLRTHGREGAVAAAAAAAGRRRPRRPPAAVRPHPRYPGAARPQGARSSSRAARRSPRGLGPSWAGLRPRGSRDPARSAAGPAGWGPGPSAALRPRPRALQRRFPGRGAGGRSAGISARCARRGAVWERQTESLSAPPGRPGRGPVCVPSTLGLPQGLAQMGCDRRWAQRPLPSLAAGSHGAGAALAGPKKKLERTGPDSPTRPCQTRPPEAWAPLTLYCTEGQSGAWVEAGTRSPRRWGCRCRVNALLPGETPSWGGVGRGRTLGWLCSWSSRDSSRLPLLECRPLGQVQESSSGKLGAVIFRPSGKTPVLP